MHYSERYIRRHATQHPLPQYPQYLMFDVDLKNGDTAYDPKNADKVIVYPCGIAYWILKSDGSITISTTGPTKRVKVDSLDPPPHDPRPDDDPEPGDRCKDCGQSIVWVGPSTAYDWEHVANGPAS
jgi:hypothetical protein